MWMLRRIKELGGTSNDMLLVYILQVRSLAEKECQVWNGSLTIKNSDILERIQKTAFKIILGQNYKTYYIYKPSRIEDKNYVYHLPKRPNGAQNLVHGSEKHLNLLEVTQK